MPRALLQTGAAALVATGLAACAAQPAQSPAASAAPGRCAGAPAFAAGGERATLGVRNSAEYRASAETIYRGALEALERGLADPAWSAEPSQSGDLSAMPPAVVMDIDETVLDNAEPQAEMLRDGTCFGEFPRVWDAWVARRAAPGVPGAAEFIRAARAMTDAAGRPLRIFFITNRKCDKRDADPSACPQQADTAANLAALGLGSASLDDDLLLQGEQDGWDGEKLSRRQAVATTHRIVLNVGDDLADFDAGVRRSPDAERERARCAHADFWGTRWFLLPNPMYGSWLVALGPDFDAALAAEPAASGDCPRS